MTLFENQHLCHLILIKFWLWHLFSSEWNNFDGHFRVDFLSGLFKNWFRKTDDVIHKVFEFFRLRVFQFVGEFCAQFNLAFNFDRFSDALIKISKKGLFLCEKILRFAGQNTFQFQK